MELSYLQKLIELFDASSLTELEIDEEGAQVRLARAKEPAVPMQFAFPPAGYAPSMPQASAPAPAAGPAPAAAAPTSKQHELKSPIVGTFYRAPAPDADPYVQVGQRVENGTTVCLIEAMKLMNEIESDFAGTIVKIMVENGQPVEYGQVLMLIEE